MAWVKVDDGFSEHPKTLGLDLAASGLWLHALCYANRQKTDGFVPAGLLRRLGDPAADAAAEQLVAAGLWIVDERGWQIHDYLAYQRSREQIEELGEKRAEAGRKGGQAPAKQTASKAEPTYPPGDTSPKQEGSKPQANGEQPGSRPQPEEEREREEENENTHTAGAGAQADPPKLRPVPKGDPETAPLPADWAPDEHALAWAAEKGWPPEWVAAETELFVGYWTRQKPKDRKRDWYQAWQVWLNREANRRAPTPIRGARAAPSAPTTAAVDWSDHNAVFGA